MVEMVEMVDRLMDPSVKSGCYYQVIVTNSLT
jgi:hypothetical protein